ncbi:MAG: type II toxin-antitoxin system HicA family toxin [Oscillatoria sp. PMC 1051.18]|uniref:type II toxin-antitoxin system HicA family toxin n=1 Tax=Oscillatoria salina TaxID=331517 RepID=UPI0013BA2366|nr:type II toxin-antitoxin system HicA family toxin [Oscillatoria salina]MBZ8179005.1 type II toxin-antitoxin system HicA family toxin [Oscillatoria salina IIICB1]MEC4893952.1 type II toxin-antitoxin system HicA family toxin [Oscillatoria sp. PMC 1050.18]MEC5032958.1 type II toxin-antitoxin system HicA family toxin [Oscillatoria sp. PMC 1051.18]NET87609.1 type II toxin-antitoxin system HicA family toxin [Kamptonema sp. SIO1D9]
MKLPRDLSGDELAKALQKLGYAVDHQTGSHLRLTTQENGEHHVTIPNHKPIKVGTLSAILRDIENHFKITREELLEQLFS